MSEGMNLDPSYAWQNAERRIFDYFLLKLSGHEGVTAFLEEWKKNVPSKDSTEMWTFHIDTLGEQLKPQPYWMASAVFDGFYSKRTTAQKAFGQVQKITPILTGVIEGVVLVRMIGGTTIERAEREMEPDKETGGEIRGYALTIPFEVKYISTEPEIFNESTTEEIND